MKSDIKNLYDQASSLGLKPFIFDTFVSQYDVFDRMNNKITNINHIKFKKAAKKILKEYKNV